MPRTPEGPPPAPVVQRVRIRYAKRGRLRFTSHRDFARAFERALRRAGVPIAFSAGFSPHPRVSYVGAAPTGVASEAEYLEIALQAPVDVVLLRDALDAALPPGLDVLECVVAGPGSLPDRIDASAWEVSLSDVAPAELASAVALFVAAERVEVERLTKDGRKVLDARGPVVSIMSSASQDAAGGGCAILEMVVRQATPAVRPDDVLAALRAVAGLASTAPPRATRLAQGRLDDSGRLADPLELDRGASTAPAAEGSPGPSEQAAPPIGTTSGR